MKIKNTILNSFKKFSDATIVGYIEEYVDLQCFWVSFTEMECLEKRGKDPYDKKWINGCVYTKTSPETFHFDFSQWLEKKKVLLPNVIDLFERVDGFRG